ncbi:MAG TPA: Maf family nucleotide pyrophosphatase [Rudaea sp.]|nr:Maf family nucleotide pyrophosphatase [Rudaea sp.]
MDLVLGSTSRYRRELLSRLTPHFRIVSPHVDETPLPNEAPVAIAVRLAKSKASAVAEKCPGAVVIGSDQVADLEGVALGKPGSVENAIRQLQACSGRDVIFHTALCVIDVRSPQVNMFETTDTTRVKFRELDDAEIARYIEREKPLDCAGSFKSEGVGITLFEKIESIDPTALIGLPMIALCNLLRRAGITLP